MTECVNVTGIAYRPISTDDTYMASPPPCNAFSSSLSQVTSSALHPASNPLDSAVENSNEQLILNSKHDVYCSTVTDILDRIAANATGKGAEALNQLNTRLKQNATEQEIINHRDLEALTRQLYVIRKNHFSPTCQTAKLIRMLEKHFYGCVVSKNIDSLRDKTSDKNLMDARPGTYYASTLSAGVTLSGGLTQLDALDTSISGKVRGGIQYVRNREVDDEGCFSKGRKVDAVSSVTASAKMNLLEKLHIRNKSGATMEVSAGVAAKKTAYTASDSYPSLFDYLDEKYAKTKDTYKPRNQVREALLTNRLVKKIAPYRLNRQLAAGHALKHHQKVALNQQDLLKEKLTELTGKKVVVENSAPFQVSKNLITAHIIEGSASAKADFNAAGIAHANLGVEVKKSRNEINVNITNSMVDAILDDDQREFYQNEVAKLAPAYTRTAMQVFGERYDDLAPLFSQDNKQAIPVETLNVATEKLEQQLEKYFRAVRASDNGDKQAHKEKLQIEKAWGLEGKGRYGMLQSAEVLLATIALNACQHPAESEEHEAFMQRISQLNEKISNPLIVNDRRKLKPLISFTRVIPIQHNVASFATNASAGITVKNVDLSAQVGMVVTHKRVDHPYRLRCGDHIDLELKCSGTVTVSNLANTITEQVAEKVGIPVSDLQEAIISSFMSGSFSVTKGTTLTLRFFSPDWSRDSADKPKYSHQVTTVKSHSLMNVDAAPLDLRNPQKTRQA